MNQIIHFYNNEPVHPSGYLFEDIVNTWSDEEWENRHDFIQWIFPTKQASKFNPSVVMEYSDYAFLPWRHLERAFIRFMQFLKRNEAFMRGEDTHNDLRVTRMLQCATLTNMFNYHNCPSTGYLFIVLDALNEAGVQKDVKTLKYWFDACKGYKL